MLRVKPHLRTVRHAQAAGEPLIGTELKEALGAKALTLEPVVVEIDGNAVTYADGSCEMVESIVWATGFRLDCRWIRIPGAVARGMNVRCHVARYFDCDRQPMCP